jgi:hypothetical protein
MALLGAPSGATGPVAEPPAGPLVAAATAVTAAARNYERAAKSGAA